VAARDKTIFDLKLFRRIHSRDLSGFALCINELVIFIQLNIKLALPRFLNNFKLEFILSKTNFGSLDRVRAQHDIKQLPLYPVNFKVANAFWHDLQEHFSRLRWTDDCGLRLD